MGSVLDNAREHYKQQLDGGLCSVDVPEWETVIYFRPTMTMRQKSRAMRLFNEGDLPGANIELLIARSLDAEGKAVFKPADRVALLRTVDAAVIERVVLVMSEASDVLSADDLEKNEERPNSLSAV